MVNVTVYKNNKNQYTGFETDGHAEYADAGSDIVCAAVSVLVLNTMNSIERFTDEKFGYDTEEEAGRIVFVLGDTPGSDAELLISSMVLGLQGIIDSYGKQYLCLNFKEV